MKPYVYYKDQILGIPDNCGNFYLFYNKKLFRQCGIPYPRSGWTWDEFVAAAKKLTKFKMVNGHKVIVQKGFFVNDNLETFLWMYGGRLFSPDLKHCVIDSEASKKGIRFWYDMRMKYRVEPTATEATTMAPTGGYGNDQLLFMQSKVGIVITGRYLIPQFRQQRGLEWALASYPRGPKTSVLFSSKSYVIPKACKHKDAALRFLAFVLSRENQKLLSDFGDGLPVRKDPGIVKDFLYNPKYPKETNNRIYIDELKYAGQREWSPYITGADLYTVINMELGKMWLSQQGPDITCDNIAKQVNAIIRRNLANPNFLR